MEKLVSSIEHITRSKPCRVGFRPWGRHLFGGKPRIEFCGIRPPAPIHHLLTLDTRDRLSPIVFEAVRFVPLIYPLAYSSGGGAIRYRVLSDRKVEILHLSEFDPDDRPYFALDSLPERNASLVPLTYGENRILEAGLLKPSFMDRLRLRRVWKGQCFRVSGMMEYEHELSKLTCPVPNPPELRQCCVWRFAYFPATQIPFGDIWHEYSFDVWFCFAICTQCGTIHGYNVCT